MVKRRHAGPHRTQTALTYVTTLLLLIVLVKANEDTHGNESSQSPYRIVSGVPS